MWANVRREKLYISPTSTGQLHLRLLPTLRGVGDEELRQASMLEAVPEENACRSELLDLIHGFDHFLPIDPDLVLPGLPHPGVYWGGSTNTSNLGTPLRWAPEVGDCGRNRASGAGTLLPRRIFPAMEPVEK